ncbi:MAG TPA: M15 family metallopeptidase [Parapedobacter sp.]|uniref:M15 family metallopeptidase n=1 Tax=Parapedobacter sp. TaxID=1958893 RepID=UPI002B972A9F|nr:M15 family metallopeptidase [Parapedobacter sp.]HWK56822.1 M15 family metallopeptidase [Parapedobacter sp.]
MITLKFHVLQPLVAAVFLAVSCAPPSPKEAYQQKYGAPTVSTVEEYRRQVAQNPDRELVDLRAYLPDAVFDVVYATSRNFMGEPVYTSPGAYLCRPAAVALQAVQAELAEMGYGLKIWDAYRPYRVTVAFYEHVLDSTFAASPYTGSKHNRGCAVDLTLIDKATGEELAMPTLFDEFTPKAHVDFSDLPAAVLQNRELLIRTMASHGFTVYADEWWHFDFRDWEQYGLMDLEFEELESAEI